MTWLVDPYDSSDKYITMYAGDICLQIYFDDITQEESEEIERFVEFLKHQDVAYENWKKEP